jgi:hypothetical protein
MHKFKDNGHTGSTSAETVRSEEQGTVTSIR